MTAQCLSEGPTIVPASRAENRTIVPNEEWEKHKEMPHIASGNVLERWQPATEGEGPGVMPAEG